MNKPRSNLNIIINKVRKTLSCLSIFCLLNTAHGDEKDLQYSKKLLGLNENISGEKIIEELKSASETEINLDISKIKELQSHVKIYLREYQIKTVADLKKFIETGDPIKAMLIKIYLSSIYLSVDEAQEEITTLFESGYIEYSDTEKSKDKKELTNIDKKIDKPTKIEKERKPKFSIDISKKETKKNKEKEIKIEENKDNKTTINNDSTGIPQDELIFITKEAEKYDYIKDWDEEQKRLNEEQERLESIKKAAEDSLKNIILEKERAHVDSIIGKTVMPLMISIGKDLTKIEPLFEGSWLLDIKIENGIVIYIQLDKIKFTTNLLKNEPIDKSKLNEKSQDYAIGEYFEKLLNERIIANIKIITFDNNINYSRKITFELNNKNKKY